MAEPITAIWLRTEAPDPAYPNLKKLVVLIERNGEFVPSITTHVPPFEAEVSHIHNLNQGAP